MSPRQKMINMMYLVLIALLALNVSKEILKAFHLMEVSFETAKDQTTIKNNDVMAKFAANMADPAKKAKTEKWDAKAKQATAISKKFVADIEAIKTKLITEAGGRKEHEASEDPKSLTELQQPDNMEKHANYFVVENNGANGLKMQKDINDTRIALIGLLNDPDVRDSKALTSRLDKQTPLRADNPTSGDHNTWVSANLEHSPLAGVITLLTKIQNDAKSLEAEVLNNLVLQIDAKATIFTDTDVKIIARSSNVMAGQYYEADIALMAYNKDAVNKIYVNGIPIDVVDGLGKYRQIASGTNNNTFEARIDVEGPDGIKQQTAKAEWSSFVPSGTISADAMNVLYIGLSNPMSISIPGVTPANTIVTPGPGVNLTKTGEGKYTATVSAVTGNKSFIRVSAKMPDGSTKQMAEQPYKIKPIPKPEALWGALASGTYPKQALCGQPKLFAGLGAGWAFDGVNFTVTRYEVVLASRKNGVKTLNVVGSAITPACSLINQANSGDIIVIQSIKASGPGGDRTLNPLTFTIN
ncbi:MAG: gliding motility protein GldM [Bacteroidia bacterium]|nr:gliding motility protein GldM [Bacteroidia bacterium]